MNKFLRNSMFFAALEEQEISAISRIVKYNRIVREKVLFFEGDQALGFYVLLTGSVRIYKTSPSGKEYTLNHIRPGQIFAAAAVFRGGGYPANCIALEDSEVIFFPKEKFLELLSEYPQIALKIISSLSAGLLEFTKQLEDLSLKHVPARLASYILEEVSKSSSAKFELRTNKTELAYRLGTIRETLSRSFRKLKEMRVIDVNGKEITVIDMARLEAIAEGELI